MDVFKRSDLRSCSICANNIERTVYGQLAAY